MSDVAVEDTDAASSIPLSDLLVSRTPSDQPGLLPSPKSHFSVTRRKHCLWVAANFTTNVRCRSLATIVAAHQRARAATFNLLALEIQVCARLKPICTHALDAHVLTRLQHGVRVRAGARE
eukprot:3277609-Prymnesium_polylepis.1